MCSGQLVGYSRSQCLRRGPITFAEKSALSLMKVGSTSSELAFLKPIAPVRTTFHTHQYSPEMH